MRDPEGEIGEPRRERAGLAEGDALLLRPVVDAHRAPRVAAGLQLELEEANPASRMGGGTRAESAIAAFESPFRHSWWSAVTTRIGRFVEGRAGGPRRATVGSRGGFGGAPESERPAIVGHREHVGKSTQ